METRPRRCQRCKAEIPLERLEAIPETRLCIGCSQEIGGDFVVRVVDVVVGKPGIKRLYGGVRIQKTRRQIRPKDES